MRKPIFFLTLVLLLGFGSIAQEATLPLPEVEENTFHPPTTFISLNSGINGFTGLFGAAVEVGATPQFALVGGVGLSGWGGRLSLGAKLYNPERYPFGSALFANYSRSTGGSDLAFNVDLDGKKYDMVLDLKPVNSFQLGWEYFFRLTANSRINLQLGYTLRMAGSTSELYTITKGQNDEDQTFKDFMSVYAPGGLTLGLGLSFKL
ncbi:MAG: hypothetical protein ACK4VN_03955 [Bacteroidales bacterium]